MDDRGDAGVEQRGERLGTVAAGRRCGPVREGRQPQQHQRADDLALDLGARCPAACERIRRALQLRAPLGGMCRGGQGAEAGGDAVVGRSPAASSSMTGPGWPPRPRAPRRSSSTARAVPGDGDDLVGREWRQSDEDGVRHALIEATPSVPVCRTVARTVRDTGRCREVVTCARTTKVPAVTRAVAVLRVLASHPTPLPAASVARELGLARSTVYQLLAALEAAGLVTHLPEERSYGLGLWGVRLGSAYLRNDPLERLSRPLLDDRRGQDGVDRAPRGSARGGDAVPAQGAAAAPHDAGDRRGRAAAGAPTAVGRSMLAHLPPAQVRALFPSSASFVDRTGGGPGSLAELRALLASERRQGWAEEDGHVTDGLASVAAPAFDHLGRPVAAIGVTFARQQHPPGSRAPVAAVVRQAATRLTRRLSGHAPPAS